MVSKRNFFAITIIMAITFFLFQFVNIAKDRWNDYETNSYAEDRNTLADKDSAYEVEGTSVVYIGKEQQDRIGNVAADWAHYMKKDLHIMCHLRSWKQFCQMTGKANHR